MLVASKILVVVACLLVSGLVARKARGLGRMDPPPQQVDHKVL